MFDALMKTVHLLAMAAWLGGMLFMLACLRPSLGVLEPPARVMLLAAVLGRFLAVVGVSAALALASGGTMMARLAGPPTPRVLAMAVLGLVMAAVYAYVRLVPYRALLRGHAAGAKEQVAGAAETIRRAVVLNLALGVVIVGITAFLAR